MGIKEVEEFLTDVKKPTEKKSAQVVPQPAKKTKKQYKERECPYCHDHVRNLGNHVKLKHGSDEQAKKEHPAPTELTRESLLGEPGGPAAMPEAGAKMIYYCQDCRAALRKGESSCWKCGGLLNWEGVE